MKRALSFFICLAICFSIIPCYAITWTCPTCERVNEYNFCPACGTEMPKWSCENCGAINTMKYCEMCGAKKPIVKYGFWRNNDKTEYLCLSESVLKDIYASYDSSISDYVFNESDIISLEYTVEGDTYSFIIPDEYDLPYQDYVLIITFTDNEMTSTIQGSDLFPNTYYRVTDKDELEWAENFFAIDD